MSNQFIKQENSLKDIWLPILFHDLLQWKRCHLLLTFFCASKCCVNIKTVSRREEWRCGGMGFSKAALLYFRLQCATWNFKPLCELFHFVTSSSVGFLMFSYIINITINFNLKCDRQKGKIESELMSKWPNIPCFFNEFLVRNSKTRQELL